MVCDGCCPGLVASCAAEDLVGAKQLFNEAGNDAELKEMARAEIKELESGQEELEGRLMILMLPKVGRSVGQGGSHMTVWLTS